MNKILSTIIILLLAIFSTAAVILAQQTKQKTGQAPEKKKKEMELPIAWSLQCPDKCKFIQQLFPYCDEKNLFAVSASKLYKLSISDGKIIQEKDIGSPTSMLLAGRDGKLFLLTEVNELHCFDKDLSKEELWRIKLDKQPESMNLSDSGLIIVMNSGIITIRNLSSGDILKTIEIPQKIKGKIATDESNARIFLATEDGYLLSVSIESSRINWKIKLPAPPTSDISYHNNMLYISTQGGLFNAIDSEDGDLEWSYDTVNENTAAAVGWDKSICFGSLNNQLYCRDYSSGSLDFRIDCKSRFFLPPFVIDEILFASPDGGGLIVSTFDKKGFRGSTNYKKKISSLIIGCSSEKLIFILNDEGSIDVLKYNHIIPLIPD